MSSAGQPSASGGVDLSACDREPIHIPGSIEPNGALLAFRQADLSITQVSANSETHLGVAPEALLGMSLGEVFEAGSAAALQRHAGTDNSNRGRMFVSRVQVRGLDKTFSAAVHGYDGIFILELEPAEENTDPRAGDVYSLLTEALAALEGAPSSLVECCQNVAAQVRLLTGFDRVMVYRFLEDESGEVIAEDRREDLAPYLGLRYPASDIPAPARRLYLANALRFKVDVNAQRAPLVPILNPDTGKPLDMTHCVLRAMSPVHDEYLRNMGVTASMSVSIVKDERLWGLVACHHQSPKTVPHRLRVSCEILARVFSSRIGSIEEEERRKGAATLREFREHLVEKLRAASDVRAALKEEADALANAIGSGLAICVAEEIVLTGSTPSRDQVAGIVRWLDENQRNPLFYTDRFSEHHGDGNAFADVAASLLSVRITLTGTDFLIWFRPPTSRDVEWAGNPAKPVEDTEAGRRISPRLSFERWKETIGNRGEPWQIFERDFASLVRQTLAELLLVQQNAQVTRLNLELERSNIELDAFAYAASHDMQEPVRTLRSYAQLLARRAASRLSSEDLELLKVIEGGAARLASLIAALLSYAQVGGRARHERRAINLEDVLRWSLMNLDESLRGAAANLTHDPLPVVCGDAEQITQLLQNLIGNSLKYRRRTTALEVHVSAVREGNVWRFGVHDNGQGFEPEQAQLIFQAFQRLHGHDIPGTGIGLAICYRIVELHGGRIWAESGGTGQGATFWFTLPAMAETSAK